MPSKIDWTTIDTGWANCVLSNEWEATSDAFDAPFSVRRIGKIVMLRGAVRPKNNINNRETTVGYLPEGFEPSVYVRTRMASATSAVSFRIDILPDRQIRFFNPAYSDDLSDRAPILYQSTWRSDYWFDAYAIWFID